MEDIKITANKGFTHGYGSSPGVGIPIKSNQLEPGEFPAEERVSVEEAIRMIIDYLDLKYVPGEITKPYLTR